MRLGIIGAGHIGGTLARHFVRAGHQVAISNSRGPETLQAVIEERGGRAWAMTAADAARFGEVVVISIPFGRHGDLPSSGFAGKVVIDTNNYYPRRDGHFPELDSDRTSSSEFLQRHLAGARVVKAFNAILWSHNATVWADRGARPVARGSDRSRFLPVLGEAVGPDEPHEMGRYRRRLGNQAIAALQIGGHHLVPAEPDGVGDPTFVGELVHERGRDPWGRGRDHDGVERCIRGGSEGAIAHGHRHVPDPRFPEIPLGPGGEIGEPLDRDDVGSERCQDRRLEPQPGPHLQDLLFSTKMQRGHYLADQRRLGGDLTVRDRDGPISVGLSDPLRGDELFPPNPPECIEDALVSDPLRSAGLNQELGPRRWPVRTRHRRQITSRTSITHVPGRPGADRTLWSFAVGHHAFPQAAVPDHRVGALVRPLRSRFRPVRADNHGVPPDPPSPSADVTEPPEDTSAGSGLELTSLDLSEIVRDSVAEASVASPAVVVEVSTPRTLPAVGEAEALSGVVRMLVDNACRQSDAGVTVKAKRGDEGITVQVIDRGPGMDREHAPDGFAQAKTLVALHGGILWAEPLPGGGTRVAFTIPEQPPDLEGQDLEEATEALRLLGQIAAAPSAGSAQQVETGDTVDLREGDPERAGALDLAAIVELAAAEATTNIEEPPTEVPDPPHAMIEPPVGLEDLWPDPADEPAESSEVTGPIETIVPQFVDAEVQDSDQAAVEPPPTEADMVAELGVPEPAKVPETVNVADDRGPEPAPTEPVEQRTAADFRPEPASGRGVEDRRAVAVEPPKRFVLDPLHPATQLLRGLALDYDPDADDLPSSSLGRRGRTT